MVNDSVKDESDSARIRCLARSREVLPVGRNPRGGGTTRKRSWPKANRGGGAPTAHSGRSGASPSHGRSHHAATTARTMLSQANTARMGAPICATTRQGVVIYPRDQQNPAALAAFQKADIEKWWPIIKDAGQTWARRFGGP